MKNPCGDVTVLYLDYDSECQIMHLHISMLSEMSTLNCILCNTLSHNVEYANNTASSTEYCTYEFDFQQELKAQDA